MLRASITDSDCDPLYKLRESMRGRDCSLRFKAVSPVEIKKIIARLKNSKSTGTDNIDTRTIKMIASDILPALTHVINLSIIRSQFSSDWKHAKIIPLLKKQDPLMPKNYTQWNSFLSLQDIRKSNIQPTGAIP